MKKEEKSLILEKIREIDEYIGLVKTEAERLVILNDKRRLYEEVGDFDEEDELAGLIIKRIGAYLAEHPSLEEEELTTFDKILRQNYIVRGRRHIDEFWIALEYDRRPENMFYLPRRKVLAPIIDAQQRLLDGELDFLAISQPKRTGKTTTGCGLIAHLAGRYPRKGILASGAGAALVNSFYRGVYELTTSPEYNFKEIFPDAELVDTSAEYMSMDFGVKKRFPSFTCRSIDGAIVGNTEASSLIYLDDCVEGVEEARSYDRLSKKWEKIRGDVLGRRVEGCPIVACGTRYSVHDPIGKLIDMAKEVGWRAEVVEVPALDEKDESNWDFCPGAKGSFSTDYYRKERKVVSKETWESEFQQQPYETKGLVFNLDELNYYDELPEEEPDAVIAVVDVAGDGSDSTTAPVGYVYGQNIYIEDWLFDNSISEVTKPKIARLLLQHKPKKTRFESNNGGKEFGINVKGVVDGLDPSNRLHFEYKVTTGNKVTKILVAADNIKKYFYFNRKKAGQIGTEYYHAMKELGQFVATGKVPHDDAPDVLAMMENLMSEMTRPQGKVYTMNRNMLGL